jgi:hypothetical protein
MNEAVRPRFAVDLDDIERQLAQAPAAPVSAAPAGRSDPLAELARIVGQDDPFQTLLATDKPRAQQREVSAPDDLFVAPQQRVQPQSPQDAAYGRGSAPAREAYPAHPAPYAPQPAAPDAYGQGSYGQDDYGDEYYQDEDADGYGTADGPAYRAAEKPRSGRRFVLAGALVGVVAAAGAGWWMFGGSGFTSGEPPLIAAETGPVKVAPEKPGGLEIPNQNKQIYERAEQDAQTRVVNREEQPVDVRQAVRSAGDGPPNAAAPEARAPSSGGLNLGEPRRVRTVAIRPDGTVIGAEPPAPVPPPPSSGLPAEAPAASAPAASAPAAAPPRMILPDAAAGGGSPQSSATPAPRPAAPQQVASAQPTEVAAEPAPAPTGGFAVQLGVSASEAEAQSTFTRLQQRYSDLEGQSPIIRKAEVNGNTIFRVRVGPMSREDASSLCSKLQGQGGQCFVAKN